MDKSLLELLKEENKFVYDAKINRETYEMLKGEKARV